MKDKIHDLSCHYIEQILKLQTSGNSQNVCGECYKDGLIEAYTEFLEKLGEILNNESN